MMLTASRHFLQVLKKVPHIQKELMPDSGLLTKAIMIELLSQSYMIKRLSYYSLIHSLMRIYCMMTNMNQEISVASRILNKILTQEVLI